VAKVRAYKLAEELGMDRNELVEKAREEGIELKSPMAASPASRAAGLSRKAQSMLAAPRPRK